MEPSKLKTEVSAANFETETQQVELQSKIRLCRIVELSRVGLTALALMASVAILGLSADALKVYNTTHVPPGFLLPLWPDDIDLRPTQALVAAGSIAVAVNVVSLLASKVHSVIPPNTSSAAPGRGNPANMSTQLRNRPLISTSTSLAAPIIAFIAAIVAIGLSYAVNPSGHTVHSWTCRWRRVPMQARPYFGTMCSQGEVALGLAVLLVPLEAIVLGVAAYGTVLQKGVDALAQESDVVRKGSPALS